MKNTSSSLLDPTPCDSATLERSITEFGDSFTKIETEVSTALVGMNEAIRSSLCAVCARGHLLLEGVPALRKILLIKSLATALGFRSSNPVTDR